MNTKAKDYIEPARAKMRETLEEVQNRVSDKAKDVSYATGRYVRENPLRAIAIVALASCLVGWFPRAARD